MKIEILGMGCTKCKQLYQNTQQAVNDLGIEAEIVKIEELAQITEYGVMSTPAIVVDGKVKASGKLVTSEEIKTWLT